MSRQWQNKIAPARHRRTVSHVYSKGDTVKKFLVALKGQSATGDVLPIEAIDYSHKEGFFLFVGKDGEVLWMIAADVVKYIQIAK